MIAFACVLIVFVFGRSEGLFWSLAMSLALSAVIVKSADLRKSLQMLFT
jgi:hypothetical protein